MKKIIAIVLAVLLIGTMACCAEPTAASYNKTFFDTTYSFEKAIIAMPDGTVIAGKVESWTDFEDGDQLQVKIDGKTYLTHSTNVVLISE